MRWYRDNSYIATAHGLTDYFVGFSSFTLKAEAFWGVASNTATMQVTVGPGEPPCPDFLVLPTTIQQPE